MPYLEAMRFSGGLDVQRSWGPVAEIIDFGIPTPVGQKTRLAVLPDFNSTGKPCDLSYVVDGWNLTLRGL